MDFNRYFTNQELDDLLKSWAQKYPQLLTVESIGESYEKRPIWLLTITDTSTGKHQDKPAVWIDANLHATELAGTTTTLYIAHHLLSQFGNAPDDDRSARIRRLLETTTFYLAPRLNPDGAELALSDKPRFLRSSVRRYPWPEKPPGLHEEDIDGDGRILQMRLPDPCGDWKVSPQDDRLMEKRQPSENSGQYYRLLPEGLIEEFDGYLIKVARPPEGLDFNRNFPFEWRPEGDQSGAGPYPVSEPEIKAIVDFIVDHLNINIAVTYHTFGGVILRPYSTKADQEMETEDLWIYQKMGKLGEEITGYKAASTFHDFKYHPKEVTTGAFDDWFYDHLGVFACTTELWDLPTRAGIEDRKLIEWYRDHPSEDDLKILNWIDEYGGEDAYVDWYTFEHPQIGPVELGGWNRLFSWRNPPHAFMEEEASKHLPYVLSLAEMLPRLTIHTLEVTHLAKDEYLINLVIENSGYLPTFTSRQAKKREAVRPVRIELDLPESVQLLVGKARQQLGHLEGRSNKFGLTFATSPTDNRARNEWVLRGPSGVSIKIKVLSERAGNLEREIVLG